MRHVLGSRCRHAATELKRLRTRIARGPSNSKPRATRRELFYKKEGIVDGASQVRLGWIRSASGTPHRTQRVRKATAGPTERAASLALLLATRYYFRSGPECAAPRSIMFRQAFIVAVTTFMLFPGCADNDSSLYIRGVLAIEETGCVAESEPDGPFHLAGLVDTALVPSKSYTAALLIGNQLSTQGDRDKLRTETARVSIRGAEITLTAPGGGEIDRYSVQASGMIDAAPAADSPGYGSALVPLIVPSAGEKIGALTEVTARVRVFGVTLGGEEMESNEFHYPIVFCNRCLISYVIDPASRQCAVEGEPEEEACIFGQDEPVDCRSCRQLAVCREPPPEQP